MEVTGALADAAETKDFGPLQEVLEAWTATVRLQQQPGYEAMIERMQRRERGVPAELDELRRPRGSTPGAGGSSRLKRSGSKSSTTATPSG